MDFDEGAEKDASRPTFSRPSGEVGIYVDFYDVTPIDRHHYGSKTFMIADFVDKLYDELQKVPLDVIKHEFEKKGLLNDVIFERWQKGTILAVGFNSQDAIKRMWREYEDLKVEPVFKQLLVTPELLKEIGARKITLRARIWQDEVEAAKREFERILIRPFTLASKENDVAMMRQAHAYQKTEFLDIIDTLRNDYAKMDGDLSQLTTIYRQKLPAKILKISTFSQFDSYAQKVYEKNHPFRKPYEEYLHMRKRIVEVTSLAQRHLIVPLLLVHSVVETNQQRDLKQRMREECTNNHFRLSANFDWSQLKHPEYLQKILHREQAFFLGMSSVVGVGMDTLLEIDQQLDEYWSGVDSHIKLI